MSEKISEKLSEKLVLVLIKIETNTVKKKKERYVMRQDNAIYIYILNLTNYYYY